jgi:CBS domain-containing protein
VTAVGVDDRVEKLMAPKPMQVWPEATVRDIAEALDRGQIGAVLVRSDTDADLAAGIVSERDVLRAVADGVDLDSERADDVMTLDLSTIDPSASVLEAARMMLEGEVRHLPVRNTEGVVTGIISMRDVLAALLERCDPR